MRIKIEILLDFLWYYTILVYDDYTQQWNESFLVSILTISSHVHFWIALIFYIDENWEWTYFALSLLICQTVVKKQHFDMYHINQCINWHWLFTKNQNYIFVQCNGCPGGPLERYCSLQVLNRSFCLFYQQNNPSKMFICQNIFTFFL